MAHGKTLELREIVVPEPQPLIAEAGKTYYDSDGVPFAEGDPVVHVTGRNRASRRHYTDSNGGVRNIINPNSHSRTWWKRVNLVRHWKAEQLHKSVTDVQA